MTTFEELDREAWITLRVVVGLLEADPPARVHGGNWSHMEAIRARIQDLLARKNELRALHAKAMGFWQRENAR